ncbi:multidrug transporter [Microbacterium sp. H37-C3]|uniref:multidrug transporter n=1 Tax=Microbacterium sp. H37-C3 TaxID=3004354 RepID=UPI0022AF912E|nr:multidrug transporter [Microbacterium sp. H37-C3]MCZ4067523.1 multidrug transporter [Microbacterium sp. H37-C3]
MSDASEPLTDEDARREELLRAGGSTEADAAPRIETSEHDGVTRIDIADSAAVRPGPGPGTPDADGDEPEVER